MAGSRSTAPLNRSNSVFIGPVFLGIYATRRTACAWEETSLGEAFPASNGGTGLAASRFLVPYARRSRENLHWKGVRDRAFSNFLLFSKRKHAIIPVGNLKVEFR